MKKRMTVFLAFLALPSAAADIVLTPPAGFGVSITNSTGSVTQTFFGENGIVSMAGNLSLANSTATTGNILKGASPFLHTYGSQNLFAGLGAGNFTLTGSNNAAVGANTLQALTTGIYNSAFGFAALSDTTNGIQNVGIGALTFANNTTGDNNIGIGMLAGRISTTGSNNISIGYLSLYNNTSGSSNIAIGASAGTNWTTGNYNIALHSVGVTAESFTMRLGTPGTHTRAFVAGARGVVTGNADAIPVMIDSLSQLGTVSSSRAAKDDIADMDAASADLMKLRPVTFHYKAYGPQSRLQYGLVAEEVEEVYPGLVARFPDGATETVMYHFLPPMLLNEYQKQQRRIEAQDAQIARLEQRLASMADTLSRLTEKERQ